MQITVGFKNEKDPVGREILEVSNLEELAKAVTTENYSLSVFKNNYRNKQNFIKAEAIALDFDSDYTIDEAVRDFKEYSHIIAPSRSHRKEKNGVVTDRFRVILILKYPIIDSDTFTATWFSLAKLWPATDPSCKDASRLWFASTKIVSIGRGKYVEPIAPETSTPIVTKLYNTVTGVHGELSKNTFKFLLHGVESGSRNDATMRAARDYQQNLYSVEECINEIVGALKDNGTIASDFTETEVVTTIRSTFNTPAKHEPRIEEKAFNLKRIGDLYNETADAKIEWLVDELLQVGGVSLLSADPKAGKSVIARQLCAHILTGTKFFDRAVKQGTCHYYGIEEHPTILAASFKRLGVSSGSDLFVHAGDPIKDENVFKEFEETIVNAKPALAVIDTAFDILEVESENNYREVKKAFRKIRKVARESGTHIMLIHHNGKPQQGFRRRGNHSPIGSTAITAGVDSILIVEIDGRNRFISSSGREVNPWHNQRLIWDKESKTYSLSKETKDEF